MTEPPRIKVELHDHNQLELTLWNRTGLALSINNDQIAMGNDKGSREYVMARFLKTIQDSVNYMLMPPKKKEGG